MKQKVMTILFIIAFAVMPLFGGGMNTAWAAEGESDYSAMPANPEKIGALLVKTGELDSNATLEQREAAVNAYLQTKMAEGGEDQGHNPLARKKVQSNEEALNQLAPSDLRGRKLGNKVAVDPSQPQFQPLEGTDKLLLIAVEFSDTPYTWTPTGLEPRTAAGPQHNQIAVPENDFDLYVKDFSTQHYEDMMFTPGGWEMPADSPRYAGKHLGSMRDYYLEQSFGKYTIEGKAFGWFKVGKPEAYYGDDAGTGHDNQLPGTTKNLLSDAVEVANAQGAIPWLEYDQLDLYDLDGDLNIYEPDCIIDHPLFIHAGIDQSGGGGAQGNDAIWAHSSSASVWVSTQKNPGATCAANWPGTRIYNYTIMPEDGGVGVFAHEFGHDLGLPDEYDTVYSGKGDSVAFWSLMSSGSWVGRPAQTQPTDISAWGRYALGWLVPGENLGETGLEDLSQSPVGVRLEQSERWAGDGTYNALKVNLPQKPFYVTVPHSGAWQWFGGKADLLDTTLRTSIDLTGKSSALLSFWTWYDIEANWDFGFVQVSTDAGATWTSLPIDGTTSVIDSQGEPAIAENLPGFTGASDEWLYKTFDMSAYAGQQIQLQFRYMTDAYTSGAGFYVDDILVIANGAPVLSDDVETGGSSWTANGWTRDTGGSMVDHYYLMEWRNNKAFETPYGDAALVNFDNGLSNVYNYDPLDASANQPAYFSYGSGLLVWYRDSAYTDNWVGIHPGAGFLLPVDAHPNTFNMPGGSIAWRTRVLTYDSAFSLSKAPSMNLLYGGKVVKYNGQNAVPTFDDSVSYWNPKAPSAGVKTPTYGILFRVLGQASDGSAAMIGLGLK